MSRAPRASWPLLIVSATVAAAARAGWQSVHAFAFSTATALDPALWAHEVGFVSHRDAAVGPLMPHSRRPEPIPCSKGVPQCS